MRVITGKARGRKLVTVEGTEVVRPTSDGVKEAIFSAIQLGIEALSRGAAECWFVDSAAVSIKAVRDNLKSTGLEGEAKVVNMPFSAFLKSTNAVFDIAILDPPYNYKIIQKALPNLTEKMSENGVIICEHEKECVLPRSVGRFELVKLLRHSRTSVSIYRPAAEEGSDAE